VRKGLRVPDPALLETFAAPVSTPFVIEHVGEEFSSLCPRTGQPDFGRITLRYVPRKTCVELKSLKLYYQSFRDEGIFYETVTNRIRDDLAALMQPLWLQVVTEWRGRGGIRSRILAAHGDVPDEWKRG
jgi:7-cyano-7-deazaguanine reductase